MFTNYSHIDKHPRKHHLDAVLAVPAPLLRILIWTAMSLYTRNHQIRLISDPQFNPAIWWSYQEETLSRAKTASSDQVSARRKPSKDLCNYGESVKTKALDEPARKHDQSTELLLTLMWTRLMK